MAEGSVPSLQDELGLRMKEQLLRLAKKRGVSVTLPTSKPGQVCVQPAVFSSDTCEATCIAIIPARATPQDELRIMARKIAYVIARSENVKRGIQESLEAEDEAEAEAEEMLVHLQAIAVRRSGRS